MGHESAQKRLFKRFYSYAISIALRYMKNTEESEEAVNDAFLKFFKTLKTFDQEAEVKQWLRKILVNTCIDRLRVKRRLPKLVKLDVFTPASEDPVDFEIAKDDLILPILRELPPKYRAVFNLYVFEECKHREIAKLLRISEGTSKSNYARAKNILRKKLGKSGSMSALGTAVLLTSTSI